MTCTCKVGPGKFEGEGVLAFMAWEQVMIGGSDETIGPYDFFKAPYAFNEDADAVKAALAYGYCQDCIDNHDDVSYGLVISESDQGFIYCTMYATKDEYERAIDDAIKEDEQQQEEYDAFTEGEE